MQGQMIISWCIKKLPPGTMCAEGGPDTFSLMEQILSQFLSEVEQ